MLHQSIQIFNLEVVLVWQVWAWQVGLWGVWGISSGGVGV
jgi:hypothetical protein